MKTRFLISLDLTAARRKAVVLVLGLGVGVLVQAQAQTQLQAQVASPMKALQAASGAVAASTRALTPAVTDLQDPYLWLEAVDSERSLHWVREQNALSLPLLKARPEYEPIRARTFGLLSSTDKIPYVFRMGDFFYNLWTDATHKRGLLRRTTLDEYKKASPQWESVLDIDALGKLEGENWVYKAITCMQPAYMLCMVAVSRGGADAVVWREFDAVQKQFVSGGFQLPEAKGTVSWLNATTLIVGTDFGPGSMTASGYPRVAKAWVRGTALLDAKTLFEGKASDVAAGVSLDRSVPQARMFASRSPDFWTSELSVRVSDGSFKLIDKPANAVAATVGQWLFLQLRSPWTLGGVTHPAGSLLVAGFDAYLKGERRMTTLFSPTATTAMSTYAVTQKHVIVNVLDNVTGRLVEWTMPQAPGQGEWTARDVGGVVPNSKGTISIGSWHDRSLKSDPLGDAYTVNYSDFLTPDSYLLAKAGGDSREVLKRLPERFDSTGMRTEQRFATSKDGTRVPYFVVFPKDAKPGLPTMLYGYGGFTQAQRPFYSGTWGSAWLARGGVVVVANIRGGGEFGPSWHQAALKANKQKSYDDFIAVGEELVKTGVTSAAQLGIYGGSNGGLLVGAVAMQRPELFGAVISAVPLLDMRRYHTLLAGNSWVAEYGNPDWADEWAYIGQYSPYQNVRPAPAAVASGAAAAGALAPSSGTARYPRMLFTTSTRDDRVHPAHARKMVARMKALGHEVLYFENIEGGHGGAADTGQRAELTALQFSYLWMQLGK